MIYVMSDIHGHYQKFLAMLDKINFSSQDHLFICGDIVDRGPQPIELIKKIMDTPNITLLIGNHEDMMFSHITHRRCVGDWYLNGGEITHKQFKSLPVHEQKKILKYLYGCPLIIPKLEVGNRNFYLTHACFIEEYIEEPYFYSQASLFDIMRITWDRTYTGKDIYIPHKMDIELYNKYPNTTMVCGHTKTSSCFYGIATSQGHRRISRAYSGHVINIDCGCGVGDNLACLRLNDMKEFYITKKQIV